MAKTLMNHDERAARRWAVAEFVKSGRTAKDACVEFGLSWGTVYASLKEFGVSVPTGTSVKASNYDVIADLCNTDDTMETIAGRLGISKQRVWQINDRCKAAGVPVRVRKR